MNLNEWQLEQFHHNSYVQGFKIKKKLFETKSKYQKITVVETEAIGKLLLLDDKTMVSDADEFVYHELMGHIPLMTVPKAKHVLIIGGGDGGIVREVVKHPDIESVTLVEIDEMVVKVSQEFFPDCTSGLTHPKLKLVMQDGAEFLKTTPQQYDVIIIDSTDPENFASTLFTKEFYQMVKNKLTPDGVMMAQTENPFLDTYSIQSIYDNLRSNFKNVHSLSAPMLIYPGVYWSFAYCSQKTSPVTLREDKINFMNTLAPSLKWYNPEWHVGAFQLSNFHKRKIGSLK
jgi:spermidine synthase